MGTRRTALCACAIAALLALSAVPRAARADDADDLDDDDDEEEAGPLGPYVQAPASPEKPVAFLERFDKGWEDRWVFSANPTYQGKARVEDAVGTEDPGLNLPDAARHYGVGASFADADPSKGIVLQFELTIQESLECGGAYLKFLTAGEDLDLLSLRGDTPYTIMFGPDKCGDTNKVHVIFRHQSPKDGVIEEKHLSKTVTFPLNDKKPHLYTLIVRPDNKYALAIDNEVKQEGSLYEDFEPPFEPPEEIDDPEDSKPSDWIDDPLYPDPDATKPDDWDEDQPKEVIDDEAVKPEGWLDDEPELIPDPSAEMPADWDEEEDGAWEAPTIDNPKCDSAPGCGPWQRPMKANPLFKGKWSAPMIDNPAYKGAWAPRKIPNPKHFKDPAPLTRIGKVGAVAIEVWTMQGGLIFDNIMVADSEEVAEKYAELTWQAKFNHITKAQELATAKPHYDPPFLIPQLRALVNSPSMDEFRPTFMPIVDYLEKTPLVLYIALGSVPTVFVLALYMCCCSGGSKAKAAATVAKAKKDDTPQADDDDDDAGAGASGSGDAEPAGDDDEDEGKARRRTRRAN